MTRSASLIDPRVHDAQAMRHADAGLLWLALMDARNRTLGWLAAFDGQALGPGLDDVDPPWWLAGQAGWLQAHWIARNVQRGRGAAADPAALRLASIEPRAEGAHPQAVAEFEIDAQPVNWSQFAEFVDDGGYDQRQWWTDAGWNEVESTARRAPRYVEQLGLMAQGGGVLARRQGRLQRLPLAQAVLHVSAHEAAAWCRWAGRRLPTEAEWALAAGTASACGFCWGELLEWVAAPALPFPGGPSGPSGPSGHSGHSGRWGRFALDALPDPAAGWRVLRGASAWASPRQPAPAALPGTPLCRARQRPAVCRLSQLRGVGIEPAPWHRPSRNCIAALIRFAAAPGKTRAWWPPCQAV